MRYIEAARQVLRALTGLYAGGPPLQEQALSASKVTPNPTPSQYENSLRSAHASLAAIANVLRYGGPFLAARARRGLEAKFTRLALEHDPSAAGDPARLAALVDLFRRQHFQRMTVASLKSRKAKARRAPVEGAYPLKNTTPPAVEAD